MISDELYLSAMTFTRVERYRIQLGKANAAPPAVAAAPAAAAAAAAPAAGGAGEHLEFASCLDVFVGR